MTRSDFCDTRRGTDLRVTPGAEHFFATHTGPGVLERFVDLHLKSLPPQLRGMSHHSRFKDNRGQIYAFVTSFCDQGRLKTLVQMPSEFDRWIH